jgi:hypothetical protein
MRVKRASNVDRDLKFIVATKNAPANRSPRFVQKFGFGERR